MSDRVAVYKQAYQSGTRPAYMPDVMSPLYKYL